MAVKHQDKKALQIWSKEIAACGTGGTPGINSILVLVWFGLQIWSKEIAACGTGGTPGINSILVWFGLVYSSPRRLQLVGQEELQV